MKLVLLLIACCIGASWQQHDGWQEAFRRNMLPFMAVVDVPADGAEVSSAGSNSRNGGRDVMGRQRDSDQASGRQPYNHNENINNYYHYSILPSAPSAEYDYPERYGMEMFDQIDSRHANRKNPYLQLSPRLFNPLNLFFPSFFYSLLSSISSTAFSTVTSYLILNSTLTSSIITPCISLTKFATATVAPSTPLTQLCRRRRSAFLFGELADIQDDESQSTEDQQLTSQVMSPEVLRQRRLAMEHPEILSSKDSTIPLNEALVANSLVRKARGNHHTVTSTFTSYSFIFVNTTRPVTIATTSVLCLPSGFAVCN